jgi:anti-sigma-K factor RskA
VTEPLIRHEDVAGYLLGSLTLQEQAAFERHLAGCAWCRRQMNELSVPAEVFRRAAPDYDMPAALETLTLAAVERSVSENGTSPSALARRLPRPRRLAFAATAAAAAAAVVAIGAFLVAPRLDRPAPEGQIELEAVLVPPTGGPERATVVVEKTGIGREISFESDDLPILPQGEYYELWFVGPSDTRRRPNRISAGTFHPDEQGRSLVQLTAAVDPALYPILSVTAEPADGNPERTGPEVLRTRSD